MSFWDYNKPPVWFPTAVATDRGWENPDTGEILVAIRSLKDRTQAGTADITKFGTRRNPQITDDGQNLDISVYFNEAVDVTGSPQLSLTVGGVAKVATYQAGTGTNKLVFRYITEVTVLGAVVAVSPLVLNAGTIKDAGQAGDASLAFSVALQDDLEVVAAA